MFKAKVIALYILLTVLVVLTALNLVGEDAAGERRSSGRQRAQNGIEGFRGLQERDEQRRENLGRDLVSGPLGGYMDTLRSFRVELVALETSVYDAFPTSDSRAEELKRSQLRRKFITEKQGLLLKNFSETLARSVYPKLPTPVDGKTEAKFAAEQADLLEECGAVGRNQCLHRFTYLPLMDSIASLRGTETAAEPLVVLVDDRGTGWANSRNSKWSEKVTFGEDHSLLRKARSGPSHGLVKIEDVYYLATVVPFTNRAGRYNGAVLVGQELDSGTYAAPMAKALGTDLVLMRGETLLVASGEDETLTDYATRLVEGVPPGDRRPNVLGAIPGSDYEGVVFPLTAAVDGQLLPEKGLVEGDMADEVRVVLTVDVSKQLGDLSKVRMLTPLIGLFVCVLGCILLLVAVWYYQRPFEKIDQGIHEVIGGNQTYEFEFDFNEELPDSIAQNLNMMVAILTGRPMPDDIADARSQNWAESMLIGNALDVDDVAAAQGEGRAASSSVTPAPARLRSAAELQKEPAEKYYRRIYSEYTGIRERLGHANDSVTYVRFVDKVVKSERSLRESMECRAVRFNIEEKGGNAVLTPVKLS